MGWTYGKAKNNNIAMRQHTYSYKTTKSDTYNALILSAQCASHFTFTVPKEPNFVIQIFFLRDFKAESIIFKRKDIYYRSLKLLKLSPDLRLSVVMLCNCFQFFASAVVSYGLTCSCKISTVVGMFEVVRTMTSSNKRAKRL